MQITEKSERTALPDHTGTSGFFRTILQVCLIGMDKEQKDVIYRGKTNIELLLS